MTVAVLPVCAYEPVTIGIFWPTIIRASSLSSVIKFGVDKTFAPEIVETALNNDENAKLLPKFVIEPILSPRPKAGTAAPAAAVPSAELIAALAPKILVFPEDAGPLKLVPPYAVFALFNACH